MAFLRMRVMDTVRGEEVKKDSVDNLYARKAFFTTCNLETPHFYIEANPVKVIPDKILVTGPANLVIEGVRTPLVLPFAIFPFRQKGTSAAVSSCPNSVLQIIWAILLQMADTISVSAII